MGAATAASESNGAAEKAERSSEKKEKQRMEKSSRKGRGAKRSWYKSLTKEKGKDKDKKETESVPNPQEKRNWYKSLTKDKDIHDEQLLRGEGNGESAAGEEEKEEEKPQLRSWSLRRKEIDAEKLEALREASQNWRMCTVLCFWCTYGWNTSATDKSLRAADSRVVKLRLYSLFQATEDRIILNAWMNMYVFGRMC